MERFIEGLDVAQKLQIQMTAGRSGLDADEVRWSMALICSVVGGYHRPPLPDHRIWDHFGCVRPGVSRRLPYFYVRRTRTKRLAKLEEQFPEALEFLARSMRAGHAFTISLEMLGEELPEPLGQEFRTLFNEQNLGAALEVALTNLCNRVPLSGRALFLVVGAAAKADRRQPGRDSDAAWPKSFASASA